ncbi:hypothetical protein AB0G06_14045 [Nonomuraea dietziae]|uniref:hypothetical protein n=1 Tax=Nonomuraea dietziae TaxID=65515 RepID=UPI0033CE6D4A
MTNDAMGSLLHRLREASARGVLVDLRTGDPDADDVTGSDRWDADRTVPAETLRAVLLGGVERVPGEVAAVRLAGARIRGVLDLSHADVEIPLFLTACSFTHTPDLTWSRLRTVELDGCAVPGLAARFARVEGSVTLTSSVITKMADLSGARVGGQLDLSGSRLSPSDDVAFDGSGLLVEADLIGRQGFLSTGEVRLQGARVAGSVYLEGATFAGEVRLRNANVSGDLVLSDASMDNAADTVLDAEHLNVGGSMLCSRVTTHGEIKLYSAHVTGQLVFIGAHLDNPGGSALISEDGLTTGGSVLFSDAVVRGAILMYRATVGGMLSFMNARLDHPGATALALDGLKVESLLHCGGTFTAEGGIRLGGARIGAAFTLDGALLSNPDGHALTCSDATMAVLRLRTRKPIVGTVDVRHAHVANLDDDLSSWPEHLRLDGFTYDALVAPATVEERLAWIGRDTNGHRLRQPYEHLSAIYRRLGDDAAARQVLLIKHRRGRVELPWYGRAWGHLQDVTVGYGFRPLRAAAWLVGLLVAGTAFYALNPPHPLEAGKAPAFNPPFYTLDLLLPVIDFGQERAFNPTGPWQWLAYAFVLSGWILATTIVAAVTRSLSRQ